MKIPMILKQRAPQVSKPDDLTNKLHQGIVLTVCSALRSTFNARTVINVKPPSYKFYQVDVIGAECIIHYGRIGTLGNRSTQKHASHESALNARDVIIKAKIKKGYIEPAVIAKGFDATVYPEPVETPESVAKFDVFLNKLNLK